MATDKQIALQNQPRGKKRTFLQPLAIGAASAVFISLILFMGIMDLRRSERSLVGFLENQGLALVEVIQGLTQENLNLQVQAQKAGSEKPYIPVRNDPQTWVGAALAVEVDNMLKTKKLSNERLKKFAEEKGFSLVAFMNKEGRIVYRNRPLSPDLLLPKDYSYESPQEMTISRLVEMAKQKKTSIFALRRKDGRGTIIISLDRDGSNYWGLKVSIQKAMEKLGEGLKPGLIYMVIMDKRGMILESTGTLPEKGQEKDIHLEDVLAGKRKVESRKILHMKKNILDMAIPLTINGKVAGLVRLGLDRGSADIILRENKLNLFFFMIFVTFMTLFSMWLLYHNQNKHLAGIVEIERRLEKAERLSALGQLAAGVAHEIRNPLNAISMASQRLKREFNPPDETKNRDFQMLSGVIRDEIRRLNGIIEEFLSFSKSRKLELHNYSVVEVLQKIVTLIREEALSKGIVLKTEWGANPLIIPMDMDKLQQALLNFVKNAMESIRGEGAITLAVVQKDKDRIGITISDTGCGMGKEEMERIFNPEYTTKEKGLGLGLALAHEIIRGHGGEIHVFSTPGKGTTFEILLPSTNADSRVNGKAAVA